MWVIRDTGENTTAIQVRIAIIDQHVFSGRRSRGGRPSRPRVSPWWERRKFAEQGCTRLPDLSEPLRLGQDQARCPDTRQRPHLPSQQICVPGRYIGYKWLVALCSKNDKSSQRYSPEVAGSHEKPWRPDGRLSRYQVDRCISDV